MLRAIESLPALPGQRAPNLGRRPELRWVSPTALLVDETYQRDLGRRSLRLIRTLVENFAWSKMKPPIVVQVDGGFHCVDGQHTAIAAATLGLAEIPVFLVDAASQQQRAEAFVAHNRDRVTMSGMDVYRGLLAAGDPDALDTAAVCRRAGIRLRQINQFGKILPGDTNCVGTVQRLVKRRGVMKARMILESFVKGDRGAIGPGEIDAAESVMVRHGVSSDDMGRAIKALGDFGVLQAKAKAAAERKPHKIVLAGMYLAQLRKAGAGSLQAAA